jgi:hypothetical protein
VRLVLEELMYLRLPGHLEPSAMGFFTVSRGTLTGLLSTILTYMIILIQFDQSSTRISLAANSSSVK